jgi:hypothetical protein
VLKNLEVLIQDSKNKENERVRELKQRQRNLGEEMQKQQAQKEMRRRELE